MVRSDATPHWGTPQQNLQLGLTLSHAVTGAPAEMALTLHFRNTGSTPFHLNTSGKVSWHVALVPQTAQSGGASYSGSLDYPRQA